MTCIKPTAPFGPRASGLRYAKGKAWQPPSKDGDSLARLLTRYTTSKGPLPADRFAERRSTVGPSLCTSSRGLHAAEQTPGRDGSTKLTIPSRPSRLRMGAGVTSRPRRSGPACWRAQQPPCCAWRAVAALAARRRAGVHSRQIWQCRSRAMDQQDAHVGAPALADPRQARLAAGGDLAEDEPQPGEHHRYYPVGSLPSSR